ncbi:MAG: DUF3137 domain-containing protein [Clostridia bacterium]|nr:DUF3137 domain-containing protein [Clostridia bacterium]
MEELEELRLKIKKRYIIFGSVTFLSLILTLMMFFTGNIGAIFFIAIAVHLIGMSSMLVSTNKLNQNYRKLFKNMFVFQALNGLFTNLYYNPSMGIPSYVIAATNMMRMGDIYHSEDYVSGEYKGIKFAQADVHIQEEHESTDSDGNTTTTYVTIFKGRWMIFDFNKNFKADVQISQEGFGNSKVKRFFGKKEERFKKVKMESESFNKKFKVFAQNEHEAFYLITPSLMERIERLAQNTKGKMLFCFVNNKLHVGVQNGKDSFEPTSVFKKLNVEKIKNDISSDIMLITQFVDELNLDNNLFKKEV